MTVESLNKSNENTRREQAKQELDEQLKYYDSVLSDDTVRLYLSDHGYTGFKDKFHVLLNIWEKTKNPRDIKGLFSYVDFTKLMEQVMQGEEIREETFAREYVDIQSVDTYSKKYIRDIMSKKADLLEMKRFGYRGMIDQEHFYVRFSTGDEWLSKQSDVAEPCLFWGNYICDEEKAAKLRERIAPYPIEDMGLEKFRYSKYLHRVLENQKRYLNQQLGQITQLLERCLKDLPDDSVGIRQGGFHSLILYHHLSEASKKKIRCFVDRVENCDCKGLGKPVLTLETAIEEGIQGMILSSFLNIEQLRRESNAYPDSIKIIDLYQELEQMGILCTKDYFLELMPEDVWDVGFPFDEE